MLRIGAFYSPKIRCLTVVKETVALVSIHFQVQDAQVEFEVRVNFDGFKAEEGCLGELWIE